MKIMVPLFAENMRDIEGQTIFDTEKMVKRVEVMRFAGKDGPISRLYERIERNGIIVFRRMKEVG